MGKRFLTKKRVKLIGLTSAGFACLGILILAGIDNGYLSETAKENADIALAISAGLLIFGVVAPLNASDIFYRSKNKELRDRINNNKFFKLFIIEETDNG